MKPAEILDHFEKLAKALSIEFRYEKGEFKGALCRINDIQILIVNSKLTEDEKIRIFARELCQLDLEKVYMVPAIREILDDERAQLDRQSES